MQWYLHPVMEDTVINPFIFYVQQIPPGSRSGRVKTQGSQVFYVWKGKGSTVMDGVRHHWEDGAVLPVMSYPVHHRGAFAFPDIKDLAALGLDTPASAAGRNLLNVKDKGVDDRILHDRVEIPLHKPLPVQFPGQFPAQTVDNRILLVRPVLVP